MSPLRHQRTMPVVNFRGNDKALMKACCGLTPELEMKKKEKSRKLSAFVSATNPNPREAEGLALADREGGIKQ